MRRYHHGFTLIELMITLSILVIVTTIAVPSFSDYIANQRVKAAATDLFASLNYARVEALKRNATVYVKANGGNWADGWSITSDSIKTYAECVADATDCMRIQPQLSGVTVTGSVTQIGFERTGRVGTGGNATFSFCDPSGSSRVSQHTIAVSLSGRPNIQLNGNCSG